MAGHYTYSVATGAVALSSAATKSMWILVPGLNPITVVEWGVSFDASAASTAVRVDLYTTTSLGTYAGTAGTVQLWMDQAAPAATTTAKTALTTEPTSVNVIANWYLQPFGGVFTIQYPLMREPGIGADKTTQGIGLRCVTPSGVTPNCSAYVVIDEG